MDSYKPHTSTYILAAMAILLCLIAITGATLALFTSGDDGKIGINATAGNLEVDIIDATNNPQSLVTKTLSIVSEDGEPIYFEPGAVYHTEGFRVANKGDIPFNYIIYISKQSEKDEENVTNFADAFDVWITTYPTREWKVDDLYKFRGSLPANENSEIYYLVFRMKEDAGNKYQNRRYSGIGITVCAVQGNVDID